MIKAKWADKIRELGPGDTFLVTFSDRTRKSILTVAARIGIKISTERLRDHLLVTRNGDSLKAK